MASQTSGIPEITFVDSPEILQTFLREFNNATTQDSLPTLYLDLEGVKLSRHGSISLLTLLIHYDKTSQSVYLFDIHTLKASTFDASITNAHFTSLRQILESSTIKKVIFDVRNDNDALFAHFDIRMQNVVDLQLMEHAFRFNKPISVFKKQYLSGLSNCITYDSPMTPAEKRAWNTFKEKGGQAFKPEKGGSYEVFNKRPLHPDLIIYCVQDVVCMPGLYEVYARQLDFATKKGNWEKKVVAETEKRLLDSMSEGYLPHGPSKSLAPKW